MTGQWGVCVDLHIAPPGLVQVRSHTQYSHPPKYGNGDLEGGHELHNDAGCVWVCVCALLIAFNYVNLHLSYS